MTGGRYCKIGWRQPVYFKRQGQHGPVRILWKDGKPLQSPITLTKTASNAASPR